MPKVRSLYDVLPKPDGPRARLGRFTAGYREPLVSVKLRREAEGLIYRTRTPSAEDEVRTYAVQVKEAFISAARRVPEIGISEDIMGGAPCIAQTRIPVYMVLDAMEYHGNFEGVQNSFPGLSAEQIKSALSFAKLVVECPIDETCPAAR